MKREYLIDLTRFAAAFLVMFGHLAFGGTVSLDANLLQWAPADAPRPLLDATTHAWWVPDHYMLSNWGTASAIIGVALFFLISGWVVPPMLARYSCSGFLLNRVLRIFPMLIVAVVAAGALQYAMGDRLSLNWAAVLSTAFLAGELTGLPISLGVVWTLVVEFKFYILLALIGPLTQTRIFSTLAVMLALFLLAWVAPLDMPSAIQRQLHDLHYMALMLCSASLFLVMRDARPNFTAPVVALVIFNVIRWVCVGPLGIQPSQDIGPVTQALVVPAFVAVIWLQNRMGVGQSWSRIKPIADTTYSLYLLHVPFGVALLSVLQPFISNTYLLLSAVFFVLIALSSATYRMVERPFTVGRRLVLGTHSLARPRTP